MDEEKWTPKVGEWVVYRPFNGPAEDGEVVEIRGDNAMVRYGWSSASAKSTPISMLTPGSAIAKGQS